MTSEKVLIIDDDQEIRNIILEFLEEQGYQVSFASNGQTGIEKALKDKPNLIILDIELPDMNGYEICKRMRETSTLSHIPIVMLTALGKDKDEVSGFKCGADDYITKTF